MSLAPAKKLKYPKKSHPQTNKHALANLRRNPIKNLVGQSFGRLTVVEFSRSTVRTGTKTTRTYWKCACVCGRIIEKCGDKLKRKNVGIRGCGCIKDYHPRSFQGESGFNALFTSYRAGARQFGRSFLLTRGEFRSFVTQDCHYCGKAPSQIKMPRNLSHTCFIYNGIDRKDNLRGYELDNCLPCCSTCNIMKKAMSYESFLEIIHRISKRIPNVA